MVRLDRAISVGISLIRMVRASRTTTGCGAVLTNMHGSNTYSDSAPSGDVRDTLRTNMLGMQLARRQRATVADRERLPLAIPHEGDLAADHHDPGVPIMCVIGVHVVRPET